MMRQRIALSLSYGTLPRMSKLKIPYAPLSKRPLYWPNLNEPSRDVADARLDEVCPLRQFRHRRIGRRRIRRVGRRCHRHGEECRAHGHDRRADGVTTLFRFHDLLPDSNVD